MLVPVLQLISPVCKTGTSLISNTIRHLPELELKNLVVSTNDTEAHQLLMGYRFNVTA
jgi:hypothetical protein